jgi:hypothetical protein
MEEETLDLTHLRTGFGRGFGPVVRWTTQWIHETVSRIYGKNTLFIFAIVTSEVFERH